MGTRRHLLVGSLALAAALIPRGAPAQQITGVPGSPSATMSIDGAQIPAPPQKFGGKIERTTKGSTPWWPARIQPPKGAPNVLLIMTDDSGYGVPSTFGGVIPTPALDRIAANGLRYTNFHSTALCSPTRAALITGRNHHSAGFGVVAEQATGLPWLRQLHHQGQGDDRHDPPGQRLPDVVVREEPQHAGLPGQSRSGRSTSGRPAWASNTSTASWAATRTSGSRPISPATRRTSIRSRAIPRST